MHTLCQNYSRPSGYIVRQRHRTLIYVMSLDTDEWDEKQKDGKQESNKGVLDGLFHQVMQPSEPCLVPPLVRKCSDKITSTATSVLILLAAARLTSCFLVRLFFRGYCSAFVTCQEFGNSRTLTWEK